MMEIFACLMEEADRFTISHLSGDKTAAKMGYQDSLEMED